MTKVVVGTWEHNTIGMHHDMGVIVIWIWISICLS